MPKKKNKKKQRKRKQNLTQRELQIHNNGYLDSLEQDFDITLDKASNPFTCKICMKRYPTAYILYIHGVKHHENNCFHDADIKSSLATVDIGKTIKRNIFHDLRLFKKDFIDDNEKKNVHLYKCRNCCRVFKRRLNMLRCEATCAPYLDKEEILRRHKARSCTNIRKGNCHSSINHDVNNEKRSFCQSPLPCRYASLQHHDENNKLWWFGNSLPQIMLSDILYFNESSSYSS